MDEQNLTNETTVVEPAQAPAPDTHDEGLDDLRKELAEMKAMNAKQKVALDKALKEKGDLTKQLRSKQTQDEIDAETQKEYIASLESYKKHSEAEKRYLALGMSAELAEKAADAETEGDMDALADIQRQHTEAIIKAKEAEWIGSRPRANVGDGSSSGMTKEQIMAIKDPVERQKAIAMNLNLFQ